MRGSTGFLPIVFLFSVVALALESSANASVYNLATDFTNAVNPNGVWTYGWVNNSQFQPFSFPNGIGNTGCPAWFGPLVDPGNTLYHSPVIWKNIYAPDISLPNASDFTVPTGDVSLQPGTGDQMVVVRWTAPSDDSGTVTVQGQFLPGDSGIMQTGIFIGENDKWASPIWSATDSGAFDLTLPVVPGQTLDFGVYGGYYYGNTPLELTITDNSQLPVSPPVPYTFAPYTPNGTAYYYGDGYTPFPIGYNPSGGNATVPEPSTLIVWSLLGAMGMVMAWRRQKAA